MIDHGSGPIWLADRHGSPEEMQTIFVEENTSREGSSYLEVDNDGKDQDCGE